MYNLPPNSNLETLINSALEEDLDDVGDLTSQSLFSSPENGKAVLITKSNGIISGIPVFIRVYELIDNNIDVNFSVQEGDAMEKGNIIAELRGRIQSILKGERISLNFLQRMSGIATLTHKFVEKIAHTGTKILDTRKTTPGYRFLEKQAVKQGGGVNHRFGLHDMILIKENHITAAGGIVPAVTTCLNWMGKNQISVKIEVEVQNCEQIQKIINYPIHRIMLDNFSLTSMQEAVKLINHKCEVEVSGNITLENVQKVAKTGVDFISVGSLTHSAPPLDMTILLGNK
ncbi:MAG: carboxylating nicotinate-nucleotide diphosphorylase [bacterium]